MLNGPPSDEPGGLPLTGVLLAAGRGRRAGGSKQVLPWVTPAGVLPLVAASFDAVSWACASMVVVLGHAPVEVRGALGRRRFEGVESDPDAPMSESIRAGLRAALGRWPGSAVLLHLGDHPAVRPSTLAMLRRVGSACPDRGVIPEFRGRGGHPVVMPADVAARVIGDPLEHGLRGYWLGHPEECVRVDTPDPGVVSDVDRAPGA